MPGHVSASPWAHAEAFIVFDHKSEMVHRVRVCARVRVRTRADGSKYKLVKLAETTWQSSSEALGRCRWRLRARTKEL
eukprot:1543358-Pleurochrysis_carterae.AAC.6